MRKAFPGVSLALGVALGMMLELHGSSLLPQSPPQQVEQASAILRGTVAGLECFRSPADGQIYTRTRLRVEEVFKGAAPAYVQLVHRGGSLGLVAEEDSASPDFKVGEQRLVFIARAPGGGLRALGGPAGALKLSSGGGGNDFEAGRAALESLRAVTASGPLNGASLAEETIAVPAYAPPPPPEPPPSSSATNLSTGSDGIPARFIMPDRGTPIPYLIDADYLPAGINQSQAVYAVRTALAAWTNVTSLRYTFAGMQSFGQAAANVSASDGVLRIQLHDSYNYVTGAGADVLGVGGRSWSLALSPSGWTDGGSVAGSDYHKTLRGYVVLQHTNVAMQTLSTFIEVLTHEIGHTVGLNHSSQNPSESNSLLKQAIMYYLVHADGRGATLNTWDVNVSRQPHPPGNTPPYLFDRYLDVVTSPNGVNNIPGVNTVQLRGYDLQGDTLTLATGDGSNNAGAFSVLNSNVVFTPNGWYGDTVRSDPADGSYYDILYARVSDGANQSPFAVVRTISLNSDSFDEGIPDSWREAFFGSADPSAGPRRHATDDFDGDGLSNLVEFWLGSNPTNRASNLRLAWSGPTNLQWAAKGYDVYELYSSTNLSFWTRAGAYAPTNPIPGTNVLYLTGSQGIASSPTNGSARQFFRVLRVP